MKKAVLLLLTAALLLACFTGCAAKPETPAPETAGQNTDEPADMEKITITDLAGETYTFDKPLEKVLLQWSGSGGPFMTMAALLGDEVCDYIAGMDNGLPQNRKDMYDQYIKTLPQLADVPDVGNVDNGDFNTEMAIASGADALIAPLGAQTALSEDIQPKLEAAGMPVIYMDYHAETMENHIHSTELLGTLFGKEERAQELVDFYMEHMNRINEGVAEMLKTNERPTVYIECASKGASELGNSYGNNLMWGGMVYNMGGTSIADGIVEKYAPLEAEYVLSQNPGKIIFTGSIWEGSDDSARMGFQATEEDSRARVAAILKRPGWSELDAVKNGEIYVVHHAVGRELYDCASMEAIAKYIWPDEFTDIDPTATLKEYYDRFLPFDFGGLWYMKY